MKWLTVYFFRLLLLLSVLVFFLSCSALKKTRSKTETRIQYKIDTVLHINFDNIPVVSRGTISDTLRAENKTAFAKTYYDFSLQKIILTLKGKPFDVPVKANVIKTVEEKTLNVQRKPNYFGWSFGILFLIVIFYIVYQLNKLTKILKR
jgi:hypothetical protein